jgi:beta-mannosidase
VTALDLTGTWVAAPATHDLRRAAVEPGFDDESWEPIAVPSHWRSTAAFADLDGPLWYRRRFDAVRPLEGRRRWLVLDGVFYQGDVWLDGAYLGDTEGYFAPHTFEVTEQLAERHEHELAVEVACSPQRDKRAKRNLTGVWQHWDCLDDSWNPGGIWRPVRIEETGPVRIRDLRVLCREATDERAVVVLRANLETRSPLTVVVRSSVGAVDHELTQPLAAGENHVEWTVTVERPALWWPWALGDQPLHDVVVEVAPDDRPTEISHRRTCRTGLRHVELRDWICSVNGERLFLKGSNQGPTRQALAEATPAELRRDVELARAAGLDLLRLHAHVSRTELYDAADELGVLLWQDLPLQWGYGRSVRKQAVRQAAAAVSFLGHHPSVAIWCGHNEPLAIAGTDLDDDPVALARTAGRFLVGMELPTWNRSILDRSIARSLRRADGTRPVVAHSGVWPHLPQLDGTDTHVYFGWYHGDERDLPRFLSALPRMARFVTEFGAQSVPDWVTPHDDLAALGAQQRSFERYVPRAASETFDAWREATQRYQAALVKRHVEELRRLKYRPTGGFAQFCFADVAPRISWSVLDHERAPKLAFDALRSACAPVIVVADRLPATMRPGEAAAVDVHVVSDLRRAVDHLECTATLSWDGGAHEWRFTGAVGADACERVGTLQFEAPDVVGELTLELVVRGAALPGEVANRDVTTVVAESRSAAREPGLREPPHDP